MAKKYIENYYNAKAMDKQFRDGKKEDIEYEKQQTQESETFAELLEKTRTAWKAGELKYLGVSPIYRLFNKEITSGTCRKICDILEKE